MNSHGATFLHVLAAAVAASFLTGCSYHRVQLMTWDDYGRIYHVIPYIVDLSTGNGRLIYVGSRHTNDPNSLDVAVIESLWRQSDIDVAFNEGGVPPTENTKEEAVRLYGEPGLVRYLAARSQVPVRSLDPTRRELVAALGDRFTPEQLKLFFVLLQVKHHRENPTEPFDDMIGRVFMNFNATPGLGGPPRTVEELNAIFPRYFTAPGSFHEVPSNWFDPMEGVNFMNDISRRSGKLRDEYMVDLLVSQVREGKRVFAVVGASHVVMQEPKLRSSLTWKPPNNALKRSHSRVTSLAEKPQASRHAARR